MIGAARSQEGFAIQIGMHVASGLVGQSQESPDRPVERSRHSDRADYH
jgi:hypothetical protein